MKKIFFLSAVVMSSVTAFANVSLTLKSDMVNGAKYKNTSNAETEATTMFVNKDAFLDFNSNLGSAMVKGRLNLLSTVQTPFIYLVKPMGDLSLSAGFIETKSGGFEGGRVDSFLMSLANGGISDGNGTAIGTPSVTYPGNLNGVRLAYNMGDHSVALQVQNATSQSNGFRKKQNMGFNYKGSFSDKMLMVNAGYIVGVKEAASLTKQNFLNLGLAANLSSFGLEFDYLSNTEKADTSGAKANSVTSIVAEARFKMDSMVPLLKIEQSENKVAEDAAAAGSFKRTGLGLGLEITPKSDESFRYHVGYASVSDKYGEAGLTNETVAYNQLLVGFKYSGDVSK